MLFFAGCVIHINHATKSENRRTRRTAPWKGNGGMEEMGALCYEFSYVVNQSRFKWDRSLRIKIKNQKKY